MKNMEFYICQRFMTLENPNYSEMTGCINEEIVSVDCSLFPYDERRKYDGEANLAHNEQLLAVMMVEKGDELPTLAGYEFCGFDLAEGEDFGVAGTSALANCPNCFDEVFTFRDLNKYCLLDSRQEAERLQELLPRQYPDEPHAFCSVYAIWRRISMFLSFANGEERWEFGGTGFMQLAYCKLKPNARIRKILSLRSIPFWSDDSLYVFVDDMDIFCSNYADIFCNGVRDNRSIGEMDVFDINYYSPNQLKEIIEKIENHKPLGYEIILEWLKQGTDYNGMYILGI